MSEDLVAHLNSMPALEGGSADCASQIVTCTSVGDSDLDKINGLSSMRWYDVTYDDGRSERLVLKQSGASDSAVRYGLAREGLFYAQWGDLVAAARPQIAALLPRIERSAGDMSTGEKCILLEDLSCCVQAGYFYGVSNPNNWGKDLDKAQRGFTIDRAEVTELALSVGAKLHASTWNSAALKEQARSLSWLRGAEWLVGEGRASWEASQASVARMWESVKVKLADGSCTVSFDPLLVSCLDASVAKIDWDVFQIELASRPFCLTHGDFHPANFMVRPKDAAGRHTLALLDWEIVGLGSGPQDVGQFLISHYDPEERAAVEREVVQRYFEELALLVPDDAVRSMTSEECWAEYIDGGLGRWLWFVPMLVLMCPPKMGQFFVDQVTHFAATHGVTAETVPMPRA